MSKKELKEIRKKVDSLGWGIGEIPCKQVEDVADECHKLEQETAGIIDMLDDLIEN